MNTNYYSKVKQENDNLRKKSERLKDKLVLAIADRVYKAGGFLPLNEEVVIRTISDEYTAKECLYSLKIEEEGIVGSIKVFSTPFNDEVLHKVEEINVNSINHAALLEVLEALPIISSYKEFDINAKGYFKDEGKTEEFTHKCRVKQNGNNEIPGDDEKIFYYFEPGTDIVGEHDDFVITSFNEVISVEVVLE